MLVNREAFLTAPVKLHREPTPELWEGAEVLLRPLSVAALVEFLGAGDALGGAETFSRLLALSACDEAGRLIFTVADLDAINAQGFDLVKRLGEACMRLNGMAAGQDAEAVKNS